MSGPVDRPAQAASGSSFYAGMRILPREKRQAMFDVYAFCRAVDDIADGDAHQDDPAGATTSMRFMRAARPARPRISRRMSRITA